MLHYAAVGQIREQSTGVADPSQLFKLQGHSKSWSTQPNCSPTPGLVPTDSVGWMKPLEVWFVLTVCTRSCQFYANIFMLFLLQFMLKEFEARRQQHEQLNQAAQSILTGPGEVSPSTNQVREELQGVNQKWSELTERLNSRSSQIDQAIVKSTQYQELLQGLSEKVKAVGQRLSSQSAISTQPDAVKQQLEETSEIRSDLEQLEEEIAEAQTLCDDLSVLIGEQYLKDELRKRLETVALPLKGLEDLAGETERSCLRDVGMSNSRPAFCQRALPSWGF